MDENNRQIIPVVLATDGKFAPYCSVTICSILENASPKRDYHIYIFQDSLSKEDIAALEGQSSENVKVRCIDVSEHIRRELMYESDKYPRPIYFRLFIPTLLPQYEKVIYLDSDVVVTRDIGELWETELSGMIMAAVQDSPHIKQQRANLEKLGLDDSRYFNSGVLLIDCHAFMEAGIKESCYAVLKQYPDLQLPDQDTLNLVCKEKVLFLPVRWNIMTNYARQPARKRKKESYNTAFQEALESPCVFHFAGDYKPYNASYLGLNCFFWKYAAKSPWFMTLFEEWLAYDKKIMYPQELYHMIRDIMSTGQCGWRGFFNAFLIGFRARFGYLSRQGRSRG